MVVVGNLEIAGTVNVEGIKAGMRDVKRGLDEAKESAKSAFGDMSRLGGSISSLAKPLAIIGSAIGATFMGLAAMAPQIAPHIARMQADFFRLSTVIGDVFEPVFAGMADAFHEFVNWLGGEGRPALEAVKNVFIAMGGGIGNIVDKFKEFSEKFGEVAKDVGEDKNVSNLISGFTELAILLGVGGLVWKALLGFKGLIMGLPKFIRIGFIFYAAGLAGANIGQWIGELTKDIGKQIMGALPTGVSEFFAYDVGGFLDALFGTKITEGLPERAGYTKEMSRDVMGMLGIHESETPDQTYYKYAGT